MAGQNEELACLKYMDGQMKGKMVNQNIPGLSKQTVMAPQIIFLFRALVCLINKYACIFVFLINGVLHFRLT